MKKIIIFSIILFSIIFVLTIPSEASALEMNYRDFEPAQITSEMMDIAHEQCSKDMYPFAGYLQECLFTHTKTQGYGNFNGMDFILIEFKVNTSGACHLDRLCGKSTVYFVYDHKNKVLNVETSLSYYPNLLSYIKSDSYDTSNKNTPQLKKISSSDSDTSSLISKFYEKNRMKSNDLQKNENSSKQGFLQEELFVPSRVYEQVSKIQKSDPNISKIGS